MTTPHTKVHTDQVNHLVQQMDGLRQRANDILEQYDQAYTHLASAGLRGDAGTANLTTSTHIKEAQMKINARFDQVNQVLHGGNVHYANAEADNAQQVQSLMRHV
jgi:uncharacterized protein YukE